MGGGGGGGAPSFRTSHLISSSPYKCLDPMGINL